MTRTPVAVFRRLSSGVYVIGVAHAGRINAFTAAWLTQVSFDPLLVAISVNASHASYPLLVGSGAFVVNVLRAGDVNVAHHFGTQSGRDVDKVAGTRWRAGQFGAPVLSDAVAFIECRVTGSMPAGDHMIVVAEAVDGAVLDEDASPLRYDETGNVDGSAELFPDSF